MTKAKWKLNTIYISERLQEKFTAYFSLCYDHGGCTYGIRKDHCGKLVSQ